MSKTFRFTTDAGSALLYYGDDFIAKFSVPQLKAMEAIINDADLARSISEHLGFGREIMEWHLVTKALDEVYEERDLYKTKVAQWKLKYGQAMETWAAQGVGRDMREENMKAVIREFSAEKDQAGDGTAATRILAVIGEKWDSQPI